jgi:hypothetical protein
MTRGLMKSASIFALGLAMSATAYAADLGGNCCADLEERVAELEATTARKGTRKTSLTVYGWVNKAMMHFDDGVQTNNYLGIDNTNSATRFGFRGDASINSEWKAGYSILLDVFTGATSFRVSQLSEDGANVAGTTSTFDDHLIRMRDANVWLESNRLGRVTLGRLTQTGAQGTIDIGGIGNIASASFSLMGGSLRFRDSAGNLTNLTIANQTDAAADFNYRVDGVRWDSPTWHGFVVGASIGEAREVDRTRYGAWGAPTGTPPVSTLGAGPGTIGTAYAVNLKYAGEFNGVRVASAIGYEVTRNEEAGESTRQPAIRPNSINWGPSLSLMHTATGLFLQGHYLVQERGNDDGTADKTRNFLVQAGVARNWFGIGNTALYGEYGNVKNGDETFRFRDVSGAGLESNYKMWGLGMTQNIDAAAMQLYAGYRNHSVGGLIDPTLGGGTATGFKDIGVFAVGARINF